MYPMYKGLESNKLFAISKLLQSLHPSQVHNVTYLIENQINKTIIKKKKTQNKKICNLLKKQKDTQENDIISHQFYPRIVNLTVIKFNNEETNLLNKGLKYNFKNSGFKQSLFNEILNAETAINSISDEETKTVSFTRKSSFLDKYYLHVLIFHLGRDCNPPL